MIKTQRAIAAMMMILISVSCEQGEEMQLQVLDDSPVFREFPADANGRMPANANYAVYTAQYLASRESGKIGRTVYFKDVGNKHLAADFVAGLSLDGTNNLSFYIDETRPSEELDVAVTSEAITRAMRTWDGLTCSDLGMYQVPSRRSTTAGFVSALLGFGGTFDYMADIVHAGWLPPTFFDLLAEEGSTFILAVTFTIIFTDEGGNPTDLDNNGKADVAWTEIYYNDAFPWADGAHYDVETIALHEAGHGLSQDHFGTAFVNRGKDSVQFSPRAVMNAAYSGIQTGIRATDNGGHCSNWANWPH